MEMAIKFIESAAGLVAAVGALVAGVAALLAVALKMKGVDRSDSSTGPDQDDQSGPRSASSTRGDRVVRAARSITLVGLALILVGAGLLAVRTLAVQKDRPDLAEDGSILASRPVSRNELLTREAWDFYDDEKWSEALEASQSVIKEFRTNAVRIQRELETAGVPQRSEFIDLSELKETERENIKRSIFKNGPLNDVAAAYWIRGRAAQELGKTGEAEAALREVAKLTYARLYDPNALSFWSPAANAKDELANLASVQED